MSAYDPRYTLIIDPELKYSTYHGGGAADLANDVVVDKNGYIYVVGGQIIAATHMNQLSASANGLRQAAGAATVTWSGILPAGVPAPAVGMKIYAAHVQGMRAAIDVALQANGVVPRVYTNAPIASGTRIRAQDVRETQQQLE